MENEVVNSAGCIRREYDEQKDIVLKGYKAYQIKYNLWFLKTAFILWVGCILLCVSIFCFEISGGIRDNLDKYNLILNVIMILVLISNIFVFRYRIKDDFKKFEKNLFSAESKKFAFETDGEYIRLTTFNPLISTPEMVGSFTVMHLKLDNFTVIRTPELYTIVLPNKSFYVIPLNIFTVQEVQQLDGMFSNTRGEKFRVLKDKKKV